MKQSTPKEIAMSLSDPDPKHNARVGKAMERARKEVKKGLRHQLLLLNQKTLKRLPREVRETLYESYYEQYHSDIADHEMKAMLDTLMARVCPEKLIQVLPEEPEAEEAQSQDRREQWPSSRAQRKIYGKRGLSLPCHRKFSTLGGFPSPKEPAHRGSTDT